MYILNGKMIDIHRSMVLEDGTSIPAGFFSDAEARANYGVQEVDDPVMPDTTFWSVTVNEDGSLTSTARTVEDVRATLRDRLAADRYARQSAGMTLADGLQIRTDTVSSANIMGIIIAMEKGVYTTSQYKGVNGWRSVDLNGAIAIGAAMAAYIQGCFDRESTLIDAINASTFENLQTLDLTTGWPSNDLQGGA